jgi:hypothetical protein
MAKQRILGLQGKKKGYARNLYEIWDVALSLRTKPV